MKQPPLLPILSGNIRLKIKTFKLISIILLTTQLSCQNEKNSFKYHEKTLQRYYKNKLIKSDSSFFFNEKGINCIIYKNHDYKSISFAFNREVYGHRMEFKDNRLLNYYFLTSDKISTYEIFYHPKKGIRTIYGTPFVDVWIDSTHSKTLLFSQIEYDSLNVFHALSNKRIELIESNKLPYIKECRITLNEDDIPIKIECYKNGHLVRAYMDTIQARDN